VRRNDGGEPAEMECSETRERIEPTCREHGEPGSDINALVVRPPVLPGVCWSKAMSRPAHGPHR
jgi:hypothetical protein